MESLRRFETEDGLSPRPMGHFGISSDANDTSWDVLARFRDDTECFPTTQEHADELVAWIVAGFPDKEDRNGYNYWVEQDESDTILGPIVYLLREKLLIKDLPLLKRALAIARARRGDNAYLDCWREREERVDALANEILLIKFAISKGMPSKP